MITKTVRSKSLSKNGIAEKNGKPANGSAAKPKRSMYEKWVEKYGISDSKADRSMVKTMKKIYQTNNQSEV